MEMMRKEWIWDTLKETNLQGSGYLGRWEVKLKTTEK